MLILGPNYVYIIDTSPIFVQFSLRLLQLFVDVVDFAIGVVCTAFVKFEESVFLAELLQLSLRLLELSRQSFDCVSQTFDYFLHR